MSALHITKGNFEEEVLKSDKPVLIDFWAEWCGPCQRLIPVVEELAGEVTEAKICKINTDEEPELAEEFGIMSIPTLVVIKDGKETAREIGGKTKEEMLEMLGI